MSRFIESFGTCKMFSKFSYGSFTLPWPMTSTGVSYYIRMEGLVHEEIENKKFSIDAIRWDAPEYKIHAST
jgi:hypothetical protein